MCSSDLLAILHVEIDEAAGTFCYVMELADDAHGAPRGRVNPDTYEPLTLQRLRQSRGRTPFRKVAEWGIELANGLKSLHSAGLIHRDIKPSNIILVNDHAKIADVGLVTSSADALSSVGTLDYADPRGTNSPSSDLYSLGKVLYEIANDIDVRRFPQGNKEVMKWEDGKDITCEDFKYGASRNFATDVIIGGPANYLFTYLDIPTGDDGLPQYKGPYTKKGQDLYDKAVTCDGKTITYRFKKAWPDFPNSIAQLRYMDPYREDLDKGDANNFAIISNGPYKLDGTWKDRSINVVGPRPGIGSYDVFRSAVLRGKPFRTSMDVQVVDPSIVNAVGADIEAIGFASRFLATRRTRMVPLAPRADAPAVLPSRIACLTGTYPLSRPLCFVINLPPGKKPSPLIQDFVRYCMSYEGQQDSAERGDYPVSREMTVDAYAAVGITMPAVGTTDKPQAPAEPSAGKKP